MENAIIIRAEGQFKSKSLNTATAGLAKAFSNIENGRKDACAILAKVEKNKSYSEDGFKSLAEYAEQIGLNKSLAHKMENAGRLLISENETVKAFAKDADFSKLAILSSAGEDAVQKAIEDGTLTTDCTQEEVKAIKAEMNKANKDKVLPKFKVVGESSRGVFNYDEIEIEMIPELEPCVKVGSFDQIVQLADGKELAEKWTVYANVYTGELIRIKAEKVKAEKKVKVKSVKNMTREELLAALAALDNAEAE